MDCVLLEANGLVLAKRDVLQCPAEITEELDFASIHLAEVHKFRLKQRAQSFLNLIV
jgi:hypothetical protein